MDVFALSETWISPNTTSFQLFDAIPRGFTFINTPRPVPDSSTSLIVAQHFFSVSLLSTPTATFKTFELSSVTIKLPHSNLALYNTYCPPQSNIILCLSLSF